MSQRPTPAVESESRRIEEILAANNGRRFVKRILFPFNAPTLDLGIGEIATHKMGWGESDGKFYVFPTVMEDGDGQLRDYGDAAFNEAIRRRDFITFDRAEDADWFSKNYKRHWDRIGYHPGAR